MPIAWSEKKEQRIRRREQLVFGKADGVVYISASLKDFVAEKFPVSGPQVVIHDGTTLRPATSSERDPSILCYSGQFYWWKGMSTLMESMRWVRSGTLRMYGGGYSTVHDDMALMQKVIDEHQLKDRIEFCGFLPPSRVPDALAQCSIGVLPLPMNVIANRCNSPLKLFDYMANGLAVVASDLLTIREIVHHGVNGHLVPPGDPQALAAGINRLLEDAVYRNSLASAALDTVAQYSWAERGRRLHSFLNSL
jgi:glycosyltransferase involved in cell wall biosynthesis